MQKTYLALFFILPFFLLGQNKDSITIGKQIDSLLVGANKHARKGEFDLALNLIKQSEKITQDIFGLQSRFYVKVLTQYGFAYYYSGKFQDAEKWFSNSKQLQKDLFGKNNAGYASCTHNLASVFTQKGDYEQAIKYYKEAIEIRGQVLGLDHQDYAASINNLASVYLNMSNYEDALPLYIKAKDIVEKKSGKEDYIYAMTINNIGVIYRETGDFNQSEIYFTEALRIREKVLGKEDPDYIATIQDLAILYIYLGNYKKGETYLNTALEGTIKLYGKDSPEYSWILNVYFGLYQSMKDVAKSESFLLESIDVTKRVLGNDDPSLAASYTNLAILYNNKKEFDKAEVFFLKANDLWKKHFDEFNIEYTNSLSGLAHLYEQKGEYDKSEALYLESLRIIEKKLGKTHQYYTSILFKMSILFEKQKRYTESEKTLSEFIQLTESEIQKAINYLSEKELNNYIETFQLMGESLASYLHYRNVQKEDTRNLCSLVFNYTLFHKGFLLTAAKRLNTLTGSSEKSKLLQKELKSCLIIIGKELTKPISERLDLDSLENLSNAIEKELTRELDGYALANKQVDQYEIQTKLKSKEAAIEFVRFNLNFPAPSDSIIYAALVLKPGLKEPIYIPLFEESQLQILLHRRSSSSEMLSNLYSRGVNPVMLKKLNGLNELIWRPLETVLKDVNKIFYAPSGLLYQINFDAIPLLNKSDSTLSDQFTLVRLGSTRSVFSSEQNKSTNFTKAVLFGGINYELDTLLLNFEHPKINTESNSKELVFTNNRSINQSSEAWSYLPGTEKEINEISKILKRSKIKNQVFRTTKATEEEFKNLGKGKASPSIIHLATHGFFFPDPQSEQKVTAVSSEDSTKTLHKKSVDAQSLKSSQNNESIFKVSEHPMIRSGLLLSGSNYAWKNGKTWNKDMDDGILTAYEISQLDLSNTELVVLSACETGLGSIQGNEGVYGLQRAFKIAGVKYLIMSLWQVPDKQTSTLMTRFYIKWLTEKMNLPDAFRSAQKELRDSGLDPFYWAGFILVE